MKKRKYKQLCEQQRSLHQQMGSILGSEASRNSIGRGVKNSKRQLLPSENQLLVF